MAVGELPTAGGEADCGLFVGQQLVGVIGAKKVGATLGGVEVQTLAYATDTLPELQVLIQPLQFRYESTGVETFFTNGLDPDATVQRIFSLRGLQSQASWLQVHCELEELFARDSINPDPFLRRDDGLPAFDNLLPSGRLFNPDVIAAEIADLPGSALEQMEAIRGNLQLAAPGEAPEVQP